MINNKLYECIVMRNADYSPFIKFKDGKGYMDLKIDECGINIYTKNEKNNFTNQKLYRYVELKEIIKHKSTIRMVIILWHPGYGCVTPIISMMEIQ